MDAMDNALRTGAGRQTLGPPMNDKVAVVTGASSGLGLETAGQLAARGAEVVLVCRDPGRGEAARAAVAALATANPPALVLADLSDQGQVRRVAEEIRSRYDRVAILVNNAGSAFAERRLSADGIERTWATNHLAPFLLTELLLPLLVAAAEARVVNVASEIYSKRLDVDNLQGDRKYSFFSAYRVSKLGNVLFTRELAQRIEGSGVTAVSVSPGPAKTNFGADGPGGFMGVITGIVRRTPIFRPAAKAAEGIVWAATAPELRGSAGSLYMRRKELKLKGAAADPVLACTVWQISEAQAGIDPAGSSVAIVAGRSNGHA
jgi:NAD(P)-dependent dehydrogenase (short-subunit alcohol dehydrogenase family)